MTTQEYLDLIRQKLGVKTPYAIAKALGVSKQAAGNWDKGISGFDDATALKVAELLGIPGTQVMVDMHAERSKEPDVRAAWRNISERIAAGFKAFISKSAPLLV